MLSKILILIWQFIQSVILDEVVFENVELDW